MTMHIYNPSTGEVEKEGPRGLPTSQSSGICELHIQSETVSENKVEANRGRHGTPTSGIHMHTQKVEPVIYYDIS